MTDQPTALETFSLKSVAAAALAQRMVAKLALDSPDDEWIMADSQVKQLRAFVAELGVAFREHFAERLLERGDIDLGDGRRFYPGKVKKVKRKVEAAALFDELMGATGGDFDAVAKCLSANAWKPAEVREVSPELYEESYAEEFVTDPRTGKTKREPALTR